MNGIGAAEPVLSLQNYSLWSGSQWILRNVSLRVAPGTFCVLLGANGAGKSSLLRAFAGVLQPPWEHYGQFQKRLPAATIAAPIDECCALSWLSQSLSFSDDMTVREFLWLHQANGDTPVASSPAVAASAEEFGVQALFDRRLSALSGGQWQRVRLARALGREAALYLLDEPDTALDAAWRRVLWKALLQRQSRGATLVLALHRFGEVSDFVNSWFGLEQGALVFAQENPGFFPEAFVERLFLEKGLTR
jgi:ABC-type Mn2+/Zn2+ transport system ATPase subunit